MQLVTDSLVWQTRHYRWSWGLQSHRWSECRKWLQESTSQLVLMVLLMSAFFLCLAARYAELVPKTQSHKVKVDE